MDFCGTQNLPARDEASSSEDTEILNLSSVVPVDVEKEEGEISAENAETSEEKKQRKQRKRKEWQPEQVGTDSEGRVLWKGPLDGVFIIITTKNGKDRRVYLKELNKRYQGGEGSAEGVKKRKRAASGEEGAEPKRKKVRKSKADSSSEGSVATA